MATDSGIFHLPYRPPYDWAGMLAFLASHAIRGVEWVTPDSYYRTVALTGAAGWIAVSPDAARDRLKVRYSDDLHPVLPALKQRLINLFDLCADPQAIGAHLARDRRLRPWVKLNPGARIPGAFDAFELATRAILGQQISYKAATTVSGRLASRFGALFATPFPALTRLTPTAEAFAAADVGDVAVLGIIAARSRSILALAAAFRDGAIDVGPVANPDLTWASLTALPGIGPWTAHIITMRALQWPDSFPKEDLAVRAFLGGMPAREAERQAEGWRPWRGYAVMHIWNAAIAKSPASESV